LAYSERSDEISVFRRLRLSSSSRTASKSKELYEKCENTENLTFVTQGNYFHRTADDNKKQLATLDKEMAERLLAISVFRRLRLSSSSRTASKSKELYEKCENTENLTFVTQGNYFHRTADDNKKQLATLDKEMAERLLALKQ